MEVNGSMKVDSPTEVNFIIIIIVIIITNFIATQVLKQNFRAALYMVAVKKIIASLSPALPLSKRWRHAALNLVH